MDNLPKYIDKLIEDAKYSKSSFVNTIEIRDKIAFICNNIRIKAPIRFLLACSVAKIDNPKVDIRKPYTEIGEDDSYSGRKYDESYIYDIIIKNNLPCNSTTAFLTPAFRNQNKTLTVDTNLMGRQPDLYFKTLEILEDVYNSKVSQENLFLEIIRNLIQIRDRNSERIKSLIKDLTNDDKNFDLSSEQIVKLLFQHLGCKYSSRLPVLIIAAAYKAVGHLIDESISKIHNHNSADKQTGALGDLEVKLIKNDELKTCYEMKSKKVSKADIDIALKKIEKFDKRIDNYIFITSEKIEDQVNEYAISLYDKIGCEFIILDCIGFIKHFLHFFHRYRMVFLNNYQELLINEPNSSVNQPLKEVFLTLRQALESDKC